MAIIRPNTVDVHNKLSRLNTNKCVGEDELGFFITIMPYTKPQHRPVMFIVVT